MMGRRHVACFGLGLALSLVSCGSSQADVPVVAAPEEEGPQAPPGEEPESAAVAPLPPHARARAPIAFAEDYSLCIAAGAQTYCWPAYRMSSVPTGHTEWPRQLDLSLAPLRVPIEPRCLLPGEIVGEETTLGWLNLEHPWHRSTERDGDCLRPLEASWLRRAAEGEVTSYPQLHGGARFAVVDGVAYFRERSNEPGWEAIPSVDDAIEITPSPVCVRSTDGALRCWNRVLQTATVETPEALRQGLVEDVSIGERVVDISGARALCFVTERGRAGCLCHELAALPCAEGREQIWIPDVEGARHVELGAADRLCVLTDDRLVCYHAGRRTEARLAELAERAELLSLPPIP
ncbi:MAG: hypothetical protein SangKO_026400 [Sandaracinaceae bacterium]